MERNVDGAILQGLKVNDPYLKEVIGQPHFPCVLIDIPVAGERVGHVTTDNVNGACEAVQHLIRLGHRQIAMINGYDEAAVSRDRLTGYIVALQQPALRTTRHWSPTAGFLKRGERKQWRSYWENTRESPLYSAQVT